MKITYSPLGSKGISHRPDILNCLANLSSDEVFTPPTLVNNMLDMLPPWVWQDCRLRWLDPCTKSGVFLREVARRLMVGLEDEIRDEAERWTHIYRNMLYGIAISEVTALVSRRTLYGCKDATLQPHSVIQFSSVDGNIRFPPAKHEWVNGKCVKCGASAKAAVVDIGRETHVHPFLHMDLDDIFGSKKPMHFDVIMGNPPYQQDDGGHGRSARPLYHKFVEIAKIMQPRFLIYVIPARWYAGGKGLDNFRSDMLRDRRLSHLVDYPRMADLFEGVDIAGGGCYFLWDAEHDDDCSVVPEGKIQEAVLRRLDTHDVFVRDNRSVAILRKVLRKVKIEKISFSDGTAWARNPYGYGFRAHAVPSDAKDRPEGDFNLLLMTKDGDRFIRREQVRKNTESLDMWKVVISYTTAEHAGNANKDGTKRVISRMRALPPGSACTETYLVIDTFKDQVRACNQLAYLKTRLARFLMELRTPTQHVTRKSFAFVPRISTDRKWSDESLNDFFNLSDDDIAHIESKIRLID